MSGWCWSSRCGVMSNWRALIPWFPALAIAVAGAEVTEIAEGHYLVGAMLAVPDALLEGHVSDPLEERFGSQGKRADLLKAGKAMRGPDGKPIFPIASAADAKNAVTLWLSGHHKTAAAKAHIIRNARK